MVLYAIPPDLRGLFNTAWTPESAPKSGLSCPILLNGTLDAQKTVRIFIADLHATYSCVAWRGWPPPDLIILGTVILHFDNDDSHRTVLVQSFTQALGNALAGDPSIHSFLTHKNQPPETVEENGGKSSLGSAFPSVQFYKAALPTPFQYCTSTTSLAALHLRPLHKSSLSHAYDHSLHTPQTLPPHSSPATAMSLSSRGPTATLGDLYILPFSPWSRRVLLAQHTLHAPVRVLEYHAPFSALLIWARLRFASRKITVPAYFPKAGDALLDSHTIARVLDRARAPGSPTLFPPLHDDALRVLVAHAETVQSFARGVALQTMDGNAAANLLLPRWACRLPLATSLASLAISVFRRKYNEESAACTEERARDALAAIRDAICASEGDEGGFRFLVGDAFSYADIAVGIALGLLCEDRTSPFEFKEIHPIQKSLWTLSSGGMTLCTASSPLRLWRSRRRSTTRKGTSSLLSKRIDKVGSQLKVEESVVYIAQW
eukprot:IDg6998t1